MKDVRSETPNLNGIRDTSEAEASGAPRLRIKIDRHQTRALPAPSGYGEGAYNHSPPKGHPRTCPNPWTPKPKREPCSESFREKRIHRQSVRDLYTIRVC